MNNPVRIQTALVSVYAKDGLEPLLRVLHQNNVTLLSTGGTEAYVRSLGIPVERVEDLTGFPSILGGRVKTLHPNVFGGILARRDVAEDKLQLETHNIPTIDLVVVDLYPFEATLTGGGSEEDLIEKIDIGGVSLLRAAAKNHAFTGVISGQHQYSRLTAWLTAQEGVLFAEQRRSLAGEAFEVTSRYDSAIAGWMNGTSASTPLRYGENPHQTGTYKGLLNKVFTQSSGKAVSYNNLLDVDAALSLVHEFDGPTVAIVKHNNACGVATRPTLHEAYAEAFSSDTQSPFGGVIAVNRPLDLLTAQAMHSLFFEVLLAPGFDEDAFVLLSSKANRMLLETHDFAWPKRQERSVLNGVLEQDRNTALSTPESHKVVSHRAPNDSELADMLFAEKVVKHTRSNAIVLVKGQKLLASGVGQTSRIDALRQAIEKARQFNQSLQGAAMASDAFFPFPDCVDVAHQAGVDLVIHPGGSIRDQESITFCNEHGMAMITTGIRHFKH
jgi:phosphoribosylaminoimidazolecarboxamide formyltransferase/IMP cyclohydrolase